MTQYYQDNRLVSVNLELMAVQRMCCSARPADVPVGICWYSEYCPAARPGQGPARACLAKGENTSYIVLLVAHCLYTFCYTSSPQFCAYTSWCYLSICCNIDNTGSPVQRVLQWVPQYLGMSCTPQQKQQHVLSFHW